MRCIDALRLVGGQAVAPYSFGLYAWGYNTRGQLGLDDSVDRDVPTRVGTATNWSAVAGGKYHTLAINN